MIGEVIAVGDELTSGERLDTNSQWLAVRLTDLGLRVMRHVTIADDLSSNVAAFRAAADRSDVTVVTGGLGPTADDLTREAMAEAFGRPLQRDSEVLDGIRALFRRRGREMPERNAVQADFPEGAIVVPNPHGSAPGFALSVPRHERLDALLICLPGVPAEMREMWFGTAADLIANRLGPERRRIVHRTLHCFGAGESDVERRLPDLIRRGREPSVGITASQATITLRITATGADEASCREAIEPVERTIRESLGHLVFGVDGQRLEQVVIASLQERDETIAVFDATTAGRILESLGDADPQGTTFVGGTVVTIAPVPDLRQADAAARHPTRSSAERCRESFGASWGLALQRVVDDDSYEAVPTDDAGVRSEREPIEYLEITLTDGRHPRTRRFRFAAHPDILLPRAAKQGLDLIRLTLAES